MGEPQSCPEQSGQEQRKGEIPQTIADDIKWQTLPTFNKTEPEIRNALVAYADFISDCNVMFSNRLPSTSRVFFSPLDRQQTDRQGTDKNGLLNPASHMRMRGNSLCTYLQ